MFDSLSQKLQDIFDQLGRKGRLDESDVNTGLRAVRLALLEADVNYKVVRQLTARIRERAVGAEVWQSLTPGQQVVQIVHEALVDLLGEAAPLVFSGRSPHTLALVGLQGAGKTTMAAKLAVHLRRKGHVPLLVAADVQRPAAITQLETLGAQINVPVYSKRDGTPAPVIAAQALAHAQTKAYTTVLLDTAGRIQIDASMMAELEEIHQRLAPAETLLVVDAMTGQEAVNVAEGFNRSIPITGLIMTKIDGDARGGAALSIREVTGVPIKFLGTSEKMDGLETFQPEGIASRILGMGDVLALIEKAEHFMEQSEAERLAAKIARDGLDFEDFLEQMHAMKRMGSLMDLIKLVPGAQRMVQEIDEEEMTRKLGQSEAIINSMTLQERRNPQLLNGSRKRRIARGSGHSVEEVNVLIRDFRQSRKMMKKMGLTGKSRRRSNRGQWQSLMTRLGKE